MAPGLGARALPSEAYFEEASARLRRAVPSQANCGHTLDPETRLLTSEAPEELIASGVYSAETAPAAGQLIVQSEYMVEDVNTFAALARRRTTVGILSEATRGRPERSARYRDLLAPSGIPFEMRAAFVARGRAWGAVHMARSGDGPDFSAPDAVVLARVTGIIADGIRASLRHDAGRRATSDGPGLVVLGPTDEVELITPPARPMLVALRSATFSETDETPPASLLVLAAFARARDRAPIEPVVVASALGWISIHASLPEGVNHGRVAIVLDLAAGPRVAALRLEAHGVTPRERQIAALVAQGQSNGEIATRWCSRHTPFRTTSRAFSRRPVSPRAESSSPASSSTTTCRRSRRAARSRPTEPSPHGTERLNHYGGAVAMRDEGRSRSGASCGSVSTKAAACVIGSGVCSPRVPR